MTIRERLARKKRLFFTISFACWLCFGISFVATLFSVLFAPLLAICFLGFAGCTFWWMFGLRCSNCGNNLGYTTNWPPSWGISDRIHYCPFCGIDIDTPEESLRPGDGSSPVH